MSKTSILDYEVRFDAFVELEKLRNILKNEKFCNRYLSDHSFIQQFHADIDIFPLNRTSESWNGFFEDRGITTIPKNQKEYVDLLLAMSSTVMTYIQWFSVQNINSEAIYYYDPSKNKIIRNLDFINENLNYKFHRNFNDELGLEVISLIKRDLDVDSILSFVSKDISLDFLSYLDFRTEDNLKAKEEIIRRLYIDLEKKKDELKAINSKLFDDTKFALNYSRHHREDDFSDQDKITLCDKAFYMYIQLLREPIIKQYQQDFKPIKAAAK